MPACDIISCCFGNRIRSYAVALTGLWVTLSCGNAVAGVGDTDSVAVRDLNEIVVEENAAIRRMSDPKLGAEQLELSRLALTPQFGGEADIIKSIALLPGVRGEGDGGGGFEVRGGTASQNLITADGITLYNPAHVMGIFSTFNDDAVRGATLFKGPFPVIFGGANSAVLETTLANGDMKRFHAGGSVGILLAKGYVSGPIVRDRMSFAVTARRSYADAFLQIVPKYRKTVMNFYDVTAKLRFRVNSSDYLDAAFMMSRDNMAIQKIMGLYWGNLGASLNWNVSRDRWRFLTTGSFTHYDPELEQTLLQNDQRVRQFIHTYYVNEKIEADMTDNHLLIFGARSELMHVKSAEMTVNSNHQTEVRGGWQNAVWVNWSGRYADRLAVEVGGRAESFTVITSPRIHRFESLMENAPEVRKRTYLDVQPRVSAAYFINGHHTLKMGVGGSSQNLHSIRESSTSFPFDRYALTSDVVRPERAYQGGICYAGGTVSGSFDWSAEVYYKKLRNVYDLRDGASLFSAVNLESLIMQGEGRGYGLELMVRKNFGMFTGWIGYTLSHTQTRIDGINGGRWYDANNDRRNDLSVAVLCQLSDRWNLSASWIFSSGQPLTAPDLKYELNGVTCYYYSARNSYRAPATHRLDLSATYTHRGKKLTYQWSFGVYNAYCRYNPYIVYFRDDPASNSGTQAVTQAMFGIVPSVSYTLTY